MAARKPISWFLTEKGRYFTFSAITTASIGITTVNFVPQTFFLYKYKELVHYYKNGKPVNLPDSLEQCYHKCLDILQFTDVHRKMISPFSVFGYDLFHAAVLRFASIADVDLYGLNYSLPNFILSELSSESLTDIQVELLCTLLSLAVTHLHMHPLLTPGSMSWIMQVDHGLSDQSKGDAVSNPATGLRNRDEIHCGSTNSRFGAAVGIPVNFSYRSLEDIKKDEIQVNQKNVDWNSEVGQKLADALILPEKVQQFAICREILMTQNNKYVYDSVYPFTCIFSCYTLCQYVNKKMNLYSGPLSLRVVLYTLTGLFSLGSYFLMKDMTEVYYETEVDKKLADLGPDFVQSGVIFYEKILNRNQALRELMGKEGVSKYSKLGNENFGVRQPRLALMHRKQFFEEKLAESQQKDEDNNSDL